MMKNRINLFLIVACISVSAQKPPIINGVSFKSQKLHDTIQVRINSTFLLLGILNDYNGYSYGKLEHKFDRYYPNEIILMKYVDSIVKADFKTNMIEQKNCFISPEMSALMNSFYNNNFLIDSLFNTNDKKLSFLLGVYFRNGEKIKDNIYKIQLANSPKHKNVHQFLKDLNCKNIYFRRLDNIPTIYQIYFQPTATILKYFATIEKQKENLFDAKIESLRSVKFTKVEYHEEIQKQNLKIINLFSE